jgi:hypothetical protein
VGVGAYTGLTKLSMITVGLMFTLVLMTYLLKFNFDVFLIAYVSAYAVHALMYQIYLRRFGRIHGRPGPAGNLVPIV